MGERSSHRVNANPGRAWRGHLKSHRLLLCTLALMGSAAAWSQIPAAFQGRWEVQWTGSSGNPQRAVMELSSNGGTWRAHKFRVGDNCAALEVPVEVRKARADAVTLRLLYAEQLAGCTEGTVHLQLQPDGSVTGRRGQAPLELQRTRPAPTTPAAPPP